MNDTDDHGRKFYRCEGLDESIDSDEDDWFKEQETSDRSEANLISSNCGQGVHKPVLDFDFPCRLVPSTSLDHFHLYIDKPMAWYTYEKLLNALREANLLQPGFVKNSIARKATFVRPPWIKKKAKENA